MWRQSLGRKLYQVYFIRFETWGNKTQVCFNCLGSHQVIHYQSKRRCRHCQRKHHSSICNKSKQVSNLNPEAVTFKPATQEATASLHSTDQQKNSVFLKTAIAPVASSDFCKDTNILFDEGSQRSYITECLAETIQLHRGKREAVQLASFGGSKQEARHLDTGTVFICTDDGQRLPIDVLIVPTIAVPLVNKQCQVQSLSYLRGLKLAHPVTNVDYFDIELLIGADAYWKIPEDRVIRGKGPTAVKSKIGYLLSGPLDVKKIDPPCQHTMSVVTSSPKLLRESQPWRVSTTREEVTKDSNLGHPEAYKRHDPFPEECTKHQPQKRGEQRRDRRRVFRTDRVDYFNHQDKSQQKSACWRRSNTKEIRPERIGHARYIHGRHSTSSDERIGLKAILPGCDRYRRARGTSHLG